MGILSTRSKKIAKVLLIFSNFWKFLFISSGKLWIFERWHRMVFIIELIEVVNNRVWSHLTKSPLIWEIIALVNFKICYNGSYKIFFSLVSHNIDLWLRLSVYSDEILSIKTTFGWRFWIFERWFILLLCPIWSCQEGGVIDTKDVVDDIFLLLRLQVVEFFWNDEFAIVFEYDLILIDWVLVAHLVSVMIKLGFEWLYYFDLKGKTRIGLVYWVDLA